MNREPLLDEQLMAAFLELLLAAPAVMPLLSSAHVSVDGTLLQAWPSHSSLQRIDGIDDVPPPTSGGKGFGGSTGKERTRPRGDVRGLPQRPGALPHGEPPRSGRSDFRSHGAVVASEITPADGYGHRAAAGRTDGARTWRDHQKTPGPTRAMTPGISWPICASQASGPVAQNIHTLGHSAMDRPTFHHPGYGQSIHDRRQIDQVFGWIETKSSPKE
ncbi:hypothetical protein [Synechococcus sp. GFB01]|uniref:hypothetical protein n=1 Tax=Synechococcus sp. GFB01 TaxID=1662190 RepID=UPI00128E4894|nr:hypothetical protein [Synechococcus sp. GFB01]